MKFISHLDALAHTAPLEASDECMSLSARNSSNGKKLEHNCRFGCRLASTTSINDEICFNYVHKIICAVRRLRRRRRRFFLYRLHMHFARDTLFVSSVYSLKCLFGRARILQNINIIVNEFWNTYKW